METIRKLVADTQGERLDKFLSFRNEDLSRAHISDLISREMVLVNGSIVKSSYRLKGGELIEMELAHPKPVLLSPQDIPIAIVYENEDLVVVNKPAGMVVHPSPGHSLDTLVNALLGKLPELSRIEQGLRPGIVHRLDKNTSGLMVVAKNSHAHEHIASQIKERSIRKVYIAMAVGYVNPAKGTIISCIGRDPKNRKRMTVVEIGREAETAYEVLERLQGFTLVKAFPKTGRTHQIRVHFSSIGHPLAGDTLYGGKHSNLGRQFLHAHILGFRLPKLDKYVEFNSPLPADLDTFLMRIREVESNAVAGVSSEKFKERF